MRQHHLAACLLLLGISTVSTSALALLPFQQTGNLYVSMWTGDEIAVYSPSGELLDRFTAEGLDGPRGLAFDPQSGELWVAGEFSNALHVFDRQHELVRIVSLSDFDEPVGVTFVPDAEGSNVQVSNSNGNEMLVLDRNGAVLQRYGHSSLVDPNCAALDAGGNMLVTNRLGGTSGQRGSVSVFDSNRNFQYDFTAPGLISAMAVARDPNGAGTADDDSWWVSSGGGTQGIHEFDASGALLRSLLPVNIDNGNNIIPQGIAVDDRGHVFVVSMLGEVLELDADGQFVARFPTDSGTPRSAAFAPAAELQMTEDAPPGSTDPAVDGISETNNATSGGGAAGWMLWLFSLGVAARRTLSAQRRR